MVEIFRFFGSGFVMNSWFIPVYQDQATITKFLPDFYVDTINGICLAKPKTFKLKEYHA